MQTDRHHTHAHTQPFYNLPYPGEPVSEEAFTYSYGDTRHLLGFMVQGEDKRGRHTNNPAGHHPMWTTSATTSIIPTIFTLDALPVATLPIYPGLGQAPSMLGEIPGGLVDSLTN